MGHIIFIITIFTSMQLFTDQKHTCVASKLMEAVVYKWILLQPSQGISVEFFFTFDKA